MPFARWLIAAVVVVVPANLLAAPPTLTDARLTLDLVAQEPDIMTPTGVAVDEQGRIWVIENHTHQRTPNYKGPPTDRILVFSEFDAKGRATKRTIFADGFKDSMGLTLHRNGSVYLATRSDIWQLRDTKGEGKADKRKVIVKLDSPGNYPHNGLSGFAIDPQGNLIFALGENLGASYALIGSDKATWRGGGEGGSIYRCRPDGTDLVRVATGFWNTFHLAYDAFGRLFAVDNDPDSRGPCRLLHIIDGGDYGYRYRNGRKGLHPFTAWDGELPGTLPMVAGTAEAPSGILFYEGRGLPEEYRGQALVTSWGDHVIERFTMVPHGASFRAKATVLARGGEDFRPVGIVAAPDGSVVFSDWVDKSYPVHGKGRLWRIRWKDAPPVDIQLADVEKKSKADLRKLLGHPRIEIRSAAARKLAAMTEIADLLTSVLKEEVNLRARIHALHAAASLPGNDGIGILMRAFEGDDAPEVRGEAARLLGLRDLSLNAALSKTLAKDTSPFVRMQALTYVRSSYAAFQFVPMLADTDPFVAAAALALLGKPGTSAELMLHAKASDARVRLGVLLALRRTGDPDARKALPGFLSEPDPAVRRAAIQWVGEEKLKEFAERIHSAAAAPPATRELLEALLAADGLLTGTANFANETAGQDLVARIVADPKQPVTFRTQALRMLRPDHPALKVPLLRQFLGDNDADLSREASRALMLRVDADAQELLRRLAIDLEARPSLRADAVLGLANSARESKETRKLLLELLGQSALERDALRSLRQAVDDPDVEKALLARWDALAPEQPQATAHTREVAEQLWLTLRGSKTPAVAKRLLVIAEYADRRPELPTSWRRLLAGPADPAAGERVFFHPQGPRCYACHQVDGRGVAIGPDLSTIGRSSNRDKLIESILEPSKEIAPRFTTWQIVTRDGRTRTGAIVAEGHDSTFTLADADGKLHVLRRLDVEERTSLPKSIMPDNLTEFMTRQDLRDLLAFLEARK